MATASRRRRKTTPLDVFDRTDEARLSRSRTRELSKSDINRDLSEMEGTSKMRASTRKRKRLDREDEFLLEEEKQIESKVQMLYFILLRCQIFQHVRKTKPLFVWVEIVNEVFISFFKVAHTSFDNS